jgi:hypothetical protein
MLILNLAVPSSGSTLISNVIGRLVTDARRGQFVSYFADRLSDVIAPQTAAEIDVLVKSHEPKNDLRLLAATRAVKGIVGVRDPRDCVVSLMQRFGRPFSDAYLDVANSFAHIAAVPMENMLLLRYEDWFPLTPSTVRSIANWLGLPCSRKQARGIAEQLEFSNVKAYVEQISTFSEDRLEKGVDGVFDPATGFSSKHLTDGSVGKYRTGFTPRENQIAESLLGVFLQKYRYSWSSPKIGSACFFPTGHGVRAEDGIVIKPLGSGKECCVYGPYIRLPVGVWRVRYQFSGRRSQVFDVDVAAGSSLLGQGTQVAGGRALSIDFRVSDCSLPVEFRIYAAGQSGEILGKFEGVTLQQVGY